MKSASFFSPSVAPSAALEVPPPHTQHACDASLPSTAHFLKVPYAACIQPVPYPPLGVHHLRSLYCWQVACVLETQPSGRSEQPPPPPTVPSPGTVISLAPPRVSFTAVWVLSSLSADSGVKHALLRSTPSSESFDSVTSLKSRWMMYRP